MRASSVYDLKGVLVQALRPRRAPQVLPEDRRPLRASTSRTTGRAEAATPARPSAVTTTSTSPMASAWALASGAPMSRSSPIAAVIGFASSRSIRRIRRVPWSISPHAAYRASSHAASISPRRFSRAASVDGSRIPLMIRTRCMDSPSRRIATRCSCRSASAAWSSSCEIPGRRWQAHLQREADVPVRHALRSHGRSRRRLSVDTMPRGRAGGAAVGGSAVRRGERHVVRGLRTMACTGFRSTLRCRTWRACAGTG